MYKIIHRMYMNNRPKTLVIKPADKHMFYR